MKFYRFPVSAVLALSSVSSFSAFAKKPSSETQVSFNFPQDVLIVLGIYSPTGTEKVPGLEAEVIARKNAISTLDTYLSESCPNGALETSVAKKATWQGHLVSKGSEIFSKGSLRILINAPLRATFINHPAEKSAPIALPDGSTVVFKMPTKVTSKAVSCGTMKLQSKDGNSASVIPVAASSAKDATAISLVVTNDGLALAGKTDEDTAKKFEAALLVAKESAVAGNLILPVVSQ